MSNDTDRGMGPKAALKLEYGIIGLGILALLMIFQPFTLGLFTVGSMLVVVAALANNLLPFANPQVPKRTIITAAMTVAMIFCITLLVAIFAASLYGVFFLKPPDPNTVTGKAMLNATPWYRHSFTLSVAVAAAVLSFLVYLRSRAPR